MRDAQILAGFIRSLAAAAIALAAFVRIEARADGIYYVAQPGGKPPVDFKLASESGAELVFVNPGHADRLKKVIYRRNADGSLTARIEGESGGRAFSEDFAYSRRAAGASRCGL